MFFFSVIYLKFDMYLNVLISNICKFIYFRKFAEQIHRPFGVRYNPYTQSVEVLSNAQKITALMSELRGDLCIVNNALKKIGVRENSLDVSDIAELLHSGFSDQKENFTNGK